MNLIEKVRETALLRLWATKNVPTIMWTSPQVIELDSQGATIKIPLNWRTKNHLGSMYFGVLAVGADLAAGLLAMQKIRERREKIGLVFKNGDFNFLKRAESDTFFRCREGEKISLMLDKAIASGERVTEPISIDALCPKNFGDEPVATFQLGLSLKQKSNN